MSQYLLAQLGAVALNVAIKNQSPETVRALNIAYGAGVTVGVLLPFSRTEESEADHIGLVLMAKARSAKPPAFLSTHPTDEKRLAQIKQWMPEALRYYQP